MIDLQTGKVDSLSVVNSEKSDTYHSWSHTGIAVVVLIEILKIILHILIKRMFDIAYIFTNF